MEYQNIVKKIVYYSWKIIIEPRLKTDECWNDIDEYDSLTKGLTESWYFFNIQVAISDCKLTLQIFSEDDEVSSCESEGLICGQEIIEFETLGNRNVNQ